jgi:hypothetical protein
MLSSNEVVTHISRLSTLNLTSIALFQAFHEVQSLLLSAKHEKSKVEACDLRFEMDCACWPCCCDLTSQLHHAAQLCLASVTSCEKMERIEEALHAAMHQYQMLVERLEFRSLGIDLDLVIFGQLGRQKAGMAKRVSRYFRDCVHASRALGFNKEEVLGKLVLTTTY